MCAQSTARDCASGIQRGRAAPCSGRVIKEKRDSEDQKSEEQQEQTTPTHHATPPVCRPGQTALERVAPSQCPRVCNPARSVPQGALCSFSLRARPPASARPHGRRRALRSMRRKRLTPLEDVDTLTTPTVVLHRSTRFPRSPLVLPSISDPQLTQRRASRVAHSPEEIAGTPGATPPFRGIRPTP